MKTTCGMRGDSISLSSSSARGRKVLVPLFLACVVGLWGCSSTQKKPSTDPHLSKLEGKKVALVAIEAGEPTSRKVVEVALINQLLQKGSFILISKQDVEAARSAPDQDPTDWKGLARRSGAEVALNAKVLQFQTKENEGYSAESIEDSQLAAEQGTDGRTERVFKVKSMKGTVEVALQFTDLSRNDTQTGIAKAQETVEASARTSSMSLPPRLRFLEKLTNQAFHDFFEHYQ